jgi:hypothetical protein
MTAAAQNIKRMVQAVMRARAKAQAIAIESYENVITSGSKITKVFCLRIFSYQGAVEVS